MSDVIKDFKFHMPVELVKSKNENETEDEWQIQGIASTDDEDLQGEVVNQEGLDISLLKAGRGLFNHDHLKGPENVLGQIEDAEFVDINGKKALFVKGYLFKEQERAKAYFNIMKSLKKSDLHRVHFSVEGKILRRSFDDPKKIVKARIDKVALTLDPVNPMTFCSLVKSLNSMNSEDAQIDEQIQVDMDEQVITITKSDILKTLAAGAGHANSPESRTGGEAMQMESLDRKSKKIHENKKKNKKKMLKSFLNNIISDFPDEDPSVIADIALEILKDKKGK